MAWTDELGSVLLSYRTIPQSTTGDTPFKPSYGVDAIILFDLQVMFLSMSSQALREEADLANKAREMAHIREKALKHRIANRYNVDVIP